jgi:hypothetical protein
VDEVQGLTAVDAFKSCMEFIGFYSIAFYFNLFEETTWYSKIESIKIIEGLTL